MSTPRGFMVLLLLPPPEYGPPSTIVMLEGGKGGDGGKPILKGPHKFLTRKVKRVPDIQNLYIPG